MLWNCKTGELQHTLKSERNAPDVSAVPFSPDGSVVAAPRIKGSILVWNVKTGKLQNKLAWEGKTSMWRSLAFSADGKTIFAGNTAGDLGALNWKEAKQRFSIKRHTGVVGCIAVSSDGHTVATGGGRWRQNWDHQIRLWNAKTGDELPQSRRHGGHLPSVVAMTPDGKRIVLGNWNRCFSVWDVEKNLPLHEFTRPAAYSRVTVALSPDGNVVATGGEPVLRLWNMATGALWNLSSNSKRPSGMKFTPDGKRLVAGTGDGHLMVWDVEQRKLLTDIRAHDGEIWSLDVSHDG
ncbi:MAG: hypothetical protein IH991_10955, partial [Planctomycetes bacterium]|nr:hypothetical protein [Planctomycetota bacterium]